MRGGTHQRAQLRAQQLAALQREPNRSQAEAAARHFVSAGPQRVAPVLSAGELILVDVEGPHGDRGGPNILEKLPVHLVLHVFGQLVRGAAGKQQLRPKQADAFGALRHGERRIAEQIDVRLHANVHAIGSLQRPGGGRFLRRLPRPAASRRHRNDLANEVGRRIDRDRALVAVDEDQRARQDSGGRIVQSDDRGHVQRSREDRRVIRAAAGVGDERLEFVPVELRRDGWGQLVGHEHARRFALAEHVAESGAAGRQIHAKAADHVREVPFALAQVRIFDAVEDRRRGDRTPAAAPIRRSRAARRRWMPLAAPASGRRP